MKKTLSVFATLALLFFGAACVPQENNTSETDEKEGNTETSNAPSVTVGADNISAVSVVLKGKANLTSSVSSDLTMGIMWSKNAGVLPSNSTKTEATNMDGDYNYSVGIPGLEPETTYYYRSYVTQNGQDIYGETKNFTTKALDTMIKTADATAISAIGARINCALNMTNVLFNKKELGFYFGPSTESLSKSELTTEDGSMMFANQSNLSPNSVYYFCGYAILDGKEYKATELNSFTTKELYTLVATEEATDIEPTSVNLNARLNLTDVQYTDKEYGFFWGTSENSQPYEKIGERTSENSFSASVSNLSHKTQYWYKAFIKLDKQTFYGDLKTFTTAVVPVENVSLDVTEYTFHSFGDTQTLMATVIPADATDKSVEWTTSNADVATVDKSGKVTAVGNGMATISVITKDKGKSATCEVTVAQWVTSINLDQTLISLNEGQEQTLIPTVTPDKAADKTLKWTSSNEGVAAVDHSGKVTAKSKGGATIMVMANDGSGVYATCAITVKKPVPEGAVDLGLSVFWAKCNLGASKPEDYGDYYAWGETEPYYSCQEPLTWKDGKTAGYSWASYRFHNGSSSPLTKYNYKNSYGIVDNKTVLDLEDDAAHAKLGGNWRMPTDAEWTELRAKCTKTWTTENGVIGCQVTGPNGNSIFLPAAGYGYNTELLKGSGGGYLSSSLYKNNPFHKWIVYFSSDNEYFNSNNILQGYEDRYIGRSVRPVTE